MKKILCLLFLLQIGFAQSLLPVYEGKVKPKFELVWEIDGESEDGKLLLDRPTMMHTDKEGNLYFVEYNEKCLKKLDKDGKFIKLVGAKGEGPGEFQNCFAKTVDSDGNYYVYDIRLRRISKFDKIDNFIQSFKVDYIVEKFFRIRKNRFIINYSKREKKGDYGYQNFVTCITDENFNIIKKVDSLLIKTSKDKRTDGMYFTMPILFGPELNLLKLKDDNFAILTSEDYKIRIFDNDMNFMAHILNTKRVRVSQKEKDKELINMKKSQYYNSIKDIIEFSEYKQFFDFIIQDNLGHTLVKRNLDDRSHTFDILSPKGKFINTIQLPEDIFNRRAIIDKNYIYTIMREEEDLPVIRKYKTIL